MLHLQFPPPVLSRAGGVGGRHLRLVVFHLKAEHFRVEKERLRSAAILENRRLFCGFLIVLAFTAPKPFRHHNHLRTRYGKKNRVPTHGKRVKRTILASIGLFPYQPIHPGLMLRMWTVRRTKLRSGTSGRLSAAVHLRIIKHLYEM